MDDEIEEQDLRSSVSTDSHTFPFEPIVKELKEISFLLEQLPRTVADEMKDHKCPLAIETGIWKWLGGRWSKLALEETNSCRRTNVIHGKICEVLDPRGIESEDEWEDYIITMEKDGDILATIAVVNVVKDLRSKAVEENVVRFGNGNEGRSTSDPVDCSTVRAQMETLCGELLGGNKRDTRFRRKYQRVVTSDHTLIEILRDDHLGGRAKSMFLSPSAEIRNRGFEAAVAELGNFLAEDTVAGRMRAISELRELRIRPQQDVADFCVALEKLGRKANPHGSTEDSSLEFAHILLSNLRDWPEHVQLLSALYRTKPEKAYEGVKQLALSIEHGERGRTKAAMVSTESARQLGRKLFQDEKRATENP
ncbi:hypothetical protein COOONC_00380 [Cooperia oncophora]